MVQQDPLRKCSPYQDKFPDGYCKDIIGYLPVYGNYQDLNKSENEMRRFQTVKNLVLQTRPQPWQRGIPFVRQSCLDMVDDVYCHHYFKRCYISSRLQVVCRETCEELLFKFCDREYKNLQDFARMVPSFFMDVINCSTLPFRNKSPNCYYPDKIRGQ